MRPLLQSFFSLSVSKLDSYGTVPILWADILLGWDLKFPDTTTFQSWKSQDSLCAIVKRAYRALFGPCQSWYFDTGMRTWIDPDPNNTSTPIKRSFLDWCSPYKSWGTVYVYHPFEGIDDAYGHLLHGGEVHLWSEMVDSVSLDFMLWPRAAAAAEVLWSGPSELNETVTPGLAAMMDRLLLSGIRLNRVQMKWALRNPDHST